MLPSGTRCRTKLRPDRYGKKSRRLRPTREPFGTGRTSCLKAGPLVRWRAPSGCGFVSSAVPRGSRPNITNPTMLQRGAICYPGLTVNHFVFIFFLLKPGQARFRSLRNPASLLLDLWSIDLSGAREKEGHFHNKNFLRALK